MLLCWFFWVDFLVVWIYGLCRTRSWATNESNSIAKESNRLTISWFLLLLWFLNLNYWFLIILTLIIISRLVLINNNNFANLSSAERDFSILLIIHIHLILIHSFSSSSGYLMDHLWGFVNSQDIQLWSIVRSRLIDSFFLILLLIDLIFSLFFLVSLSSKCLKQ